MLIQPLVLCQLLERTLLLGASSMAAFFLVVMCLNDKLNTFLVSVRFLGAVWTGEVMLHFLQKIIHSFEKCSYGLLQLYLLDFLIFCQMLVL
jgi:hypothetical protein